MLMMLAIALGACAEPDNTSSHAPAANAIDPPVASTNVESPPPTATELAGVAAGDLGAGSAGEAAARAAGVNPE